MTRLLMTTPSLFQRGGTPAVSPSLQTVAIMLLEAHGSAAPSLHGMHPVLALAQQPAGRIEPPPRVVMLTCGALAAPNSFTLANIQDRAQFRPTYYAGAAQAVGDLTALSNTSMSAQMLVTYVYLDQNERAKFAEGAFESVIPRHQDQVITEQQFGWKG